MIKKLKPKSEFSRNVLTLMMGTTIAQAIPIAVTPILTRLYSPEEFGVLALYLAIVSFISIIVTARYELAIVLPNKDEDAINILALSLIIMVTIVTCTLFIIIVMKNEIITLLNMENIGNFIFLIPISILLAGLYQSFSYWANRKEYFKEISYSRVGQSLTISSTQSIMGYFNYLGGLIIGNTLGRAISAFILINKFTKNDMIHIKNVNHVNMISQMIKHKDFPLINTLHAFSDILRLSGSVLLISSFFGPTLLGFYSLTLRILQIPSGVIGSALGQVLYQKFSTMHNNNEALYPHVKRLLIRVFLIALLGFGGLYIIAPALFSFVFGEKWRIVGEYSRILIPYLFMNFMISPISQIPIIINKQKEIFYIGLVGNLLFILPIIVFRELELSSVLKIISFIMTLYYLFVFYWYYRVLK